MSSKSIKLPACVTTHGTLAAWPGTEVPGTDIYQHTSDASDLTGDTWDWNRRSEWQRASPDPGYQHWDKTLVLEWWWWGEDCQEQERDYYSLTSWDTTCPAEIGRRRGCFNIWGCFNLLKDFLPNPFVRTHSVQLIKGSGSRIVDSALKSEIILHK